MLRWLRVNRVRMTKGLRGTEHLWQTIKSFVGIVSSIYATSILAHNLMGFAIAKEFCEANWWLVLVIGAVAALLENRERSLAIGTVSGTDLQVEAQVNDLFSIGASSFVIPTNTYFRTKVDNNYISYESVQGRFQTKVYRGTHKNLDALIKKSLTKQGVEGTVQSDKFGDALRYPVGTVAKVDNNGKHYYFLAMNDVNKDGKPVGQSYNNVKTALAGLERAIRGFGHCDTLAMPLIGAGHAAIRDASCDRVARDIVDAFVDCDTQLAQKLVVCVSPNDYVDARIDFARLARYIEFRCEFPDGRSEVSH